MDALHDSQDNMQAQQKQKRLCYSRQTMQRAVSVKIMSTVEKSRTKSNGVRELQLIDL